MSVETLKARRAHQLSARVGQTLQPATVLPLVVCVFLISIFVPFQLSIGPAVMSANRTVLLLLFPFVLRLVLLGRAGPILMSDILFVGFCLWVAIALAQNHGLGSQLEAIVINAVETLGPYFLGRVLIQDADTFERMARFLFGIVAFLFPFALLETLTGVNLLLTLSNAIVYSQPEVPPLWRLGLERVQSTLDHPIHFGVIVGSTLALGYMVLGHGAAAVKRLAVAGLILVTAFLSLSSGALAMMLLQIMLLAYAMVMGRLTERWQLLAVVMTVLVVFELATGAIMSFIIEDFAFNPQTAYNRTRIFSYGLMNIEANPLYGIGFNEWVNLPGMSDSVDMFWLLMAMKFGIPAGVLVTLAFLWLPLSLIARRMPDARLRAYKLGYLISIFAIFAALWTVHVWREAYVFVLFLLGSGAWMLRVEQGIPRRRRAFGHEGALTTGTRKVVRPDIES